MLLKYTYLDSADKNLIGIFKAEVKKRMYMLSKDFQIQKGDRVRKKAFRMPFIYFGGKVCD